MKNKLFSQVSIMQTADIAAYAAHVSAVMLEWWQNAPEEIRSTVSGDGKPNFVDTFQSGYEADLRKVAEKRHAMVLYPWGKELPVKIADHASIPGLLTAVTNPMVIPRDIYRTDERVIVHFPFQGRLTIDRAGDKVGLSYEPYSHQHFHVRNGIREEREPLLCKMFYEHFAIDRLGANMVINHGWWIAQKLNAMVTITHQQGSTHEDYTTYTNYGPYYPLNFLVTEDTSRYDRDPEDQLVPLYL